MRDECENKDSNCARVHRSQVIGGVIKMCRSSKNSLLCRAIDRKSSRTSVFSLRSTLPCAQTCCFTGNHARGVSSETHHAQSGLDQSKAFERRRQASVSLVPDRSAGAAVCPAEPQFLGNKSPKSRKMLARSSVTSEESREEHGALPRYKGTHIEARAPFLATSPIGSSSLTFFKQLLCDELLGPTLL